VESCTDPEFTRAKVFYRSLKNRYIANPSDPAYLYVLARVDGFSMSVPSVVDTTDEWLRHLLQFLDYTITNPDSYPEARSPLRGWINRQCQAFKKGVLPPLKASLLAEAGVKLYIHHGTVADRASRVKQKVERLLQKK